MERENFKPVELESGTLLLPAHYEDESQKQFLAPHELTAQDQELKGQREVFGTDGHGSIRSNLDTTSASLENAENAEKLLSDTKQEEARKKEEAKQKLISDMLDPRNILDLKAKFDHKVARQKVERIHEVDKTLDKDGSVAANDRNVASTTKDSLIAEYTQIGVESGKKRRVTKGTVNKISEMMNLSYVELEKLVDERKASQTEAPEVTQATEEPEELLIVTQSDDFEISDDGDDSAAEVEDPIEDDTTSAMPTVPGAEIVRVEPAPEQKEKKRRGRRIAAAVLIGAAALGASIFGISRAMDNDGSGKEEAPVDTEVDSGVDFDIPGLDDAVEVTVDTPEQETVKPADMTEAELNDAGKEVTSVVVAGLSDSEKAAISGDASAVEVSGDVMPSTNVANAGVADQEGTLQLALNSYNFTHGTNFQFGEGNMFWNGDKVMSPAELGTNPANYNQTLKDLIAEASK